MREQNVFCAWLARCIKWQLITKRSGHLFGNWCYVSKGYSSIIFNTDFLPPTATFSKLVSHLECQSYISCSEISRREKRYVILFCCQPAEVWWWVTVRNRGSVFIPSATTIKKVKERNITTGPCCQLHMHINIIHKEEFKVSNLKKKDGLVSISDCANMLRGIITVRSGAPNNFFAIYAMQHLFSYF